MSLEEELIKRHLVLVALLNAGPRSQASAENLSSELWTIRNILRDRYGRLNLPEVPE